MTLCQALIMSWSHSKSNGQKMNFVVTFKPPIPSADEYLEHLDTVVKLQDLNTNTFIIGDLNMDMLSMHGSKLKTFCYANGLVNMVTRIQ